MAATVNFVGADTTTGGNWIGVYGADGSIINSQADYNGAYSTTTPAYATATFSGDVDNYVWDADPASSIAPKRNNNDGHRIASTWYTPSQTTYTIALTFNDTRVHRVSLYALDYDSANGRSQSYTVKDHTTLAALHTVSAFVNYNTPTGIWHTWDVSGDVKIAVTYVAGNNAVVSVVAWDSPVSKSGGNFGFF